MHQIQSKTRRTSPTSLLTALVLSLIAPTQGTAEQYFDQVKRDLTRVLSEVFHRAHAQSTLGEVVRPKFGSPTIDLPAEASDPNWYPTCGAAVSALPSDPTEYPFALVLVPINQIAEGGASFTAYAVFTGSAPVTTELFRGKAPDWLIQDIGGYRSLQDDWDVLNARSEITVDTTNCGDFSFSTMIGRRP